MTALCSPPPLHRYDLFYLFQFPLSLARNVKTLFNMILQYLYVMCQTRNDRTFPPEANALVGRILDTSESPRSLGRSTPPFARFLGRG